MSEFVYYTSGDKSGELASVDAQTAAKVEQEGAGFTLDLPQYKELEQRTKAALNRFHEAEKRIKNSADPRESSPDVRGYLLTEARRELDAEVQQIQTEWGGIREQIAEDAKRAAATYVLDVKPGDRQTAEQFANRYNLRLMGATNADKQREVLKAMEKDVQRLSDEQRVALASYLPAVANTVKSDTDFSGVIRACELRKDQTLASGQAAEQLHRLDPAASYMQFRVARDRAR
ncbi:hypothetical protein M3557_04360 [Bhargavaea ginsengi]|uniref:hypothetical protein n=1 Tax=Bhargavaea ginsengi TaxID=426757 RepID=UPI00203C69D9|nr:hypothetical protein [Bhargavaea ginsengi]MCM3087141.1 hypothetical protein [Bhargavaea ginsengi]